MKAFKFRTLRDLDRVLGVRDVYSLPHADDVAALEKQASLSLTKQAA